MLLIYGISNVATFRCTKTPFAYNTLFIYVRGAVYGSLSVLIISGWFFQYSFLLGRHGPQHSVMSCLNEYLFALKM
jgi:hypothetical protein